MMIMVPPKCHSSDYDGNGNDDPANTHTHTYTHTGALLNATIGLSFMFCGFSPLSLYENHFKVKVLYKRRLHTSWSCLTSEIAAIKSQ